MASEFSDDNPPKSPVMQRFVFECNLRKLPLGEGKQVVKTLNSLILGGELDGFGMLRRARDKSAKITMCTLSLRSIDLVSQASVQHWAGLFCFAAGFRRPLFAAVQDIFPFICSCEDVVRGRQAWPASVIDEMLSATSLLFLALQNLGKATYTDCNLLCVGGRWSVCRGVSFPCTFR